MDYEIPPTLAEIASRAALNLDDHILSRAKSYEDLNGLVRLLEPCNPETLSEFMATSHEEIEPEVAFAFVDIYTSGKGKKLERTSELGLEMYLLATELKSLNQLPKERLEELRGFCVTLSKAFSVRERPYRSLLVA